MTERRSPRLRWLALGAALGLALLAQIGGDWGTAYGQTSPGNLKKGQVTEGTPTPAAAVAPPQAPPAPPSAPLAPTTAPPPNLPPMSALQPTAPAPPPQVARPQPTTAPVEAPRPAQPPAPPVSVPPAAPVVGVPPETPEEIQPEIATPTGLEAEGAGTAGEAPEPVESPSAASPAAPPAPPAVPIPAVPLPAPTATLIPINQPGATLPSATGAVPTMPAVAMAAHPTVAGGSAGVSLTASRSPVPEPSTPPIGPILMGAGLLAVIAGLVARWRR